MRSWFRRPAVVAASTEVENRLGTALPMKIDYVNTIEVPLEQTSAGVKGYKSWKWLLFKALSVCALLAIVSKIMPSFSSVGCHNFTDLAPYNSKNDIEPVLRPLPNCPPLHYIESAWFEFEDLQGFELHEILTSRGIPPKRIGGKVSVIEGPADQNAQVRALVLFGSSDQHMIRNVAMEKYASSLVIDSTRLEEENLNFPNLCLTLDVYLLIKPKTKLDKFQINVTHLGIDIKSGLTTIVTDQTSISTTSGSVTCAEASSFVSRETVIDVSSGSVTGVWALFDLLSVNTQSGSVSISVQPKEAAESKPKPAVFEAKAQSGSIAVKFPVVADLPDRDYRVDVFAQSGAVSGSYIHGTRTALVSRSGSLSADILPFDAEAKDTMLITESYSGLTSINVIPPHLNPSKPMDNLQSRHITHAGSLTLRYPQRWQGTIDGTVASGSLSIRGDGVNIIKDEKAGSTRHITAEKGDGNSHMEFGTTSGSAVITFW